MKTLAKCGTSILISWLVLIVAFHPRADVRRGYVQNVLGEAIPTDETDNGTWSVPYNISHNTAPSYNPSIAADSTGRVHVVWADAENAGTPSGIGDTIMYSYQVASHWSTPIDILLPPDGPAVRAIELGVDLGGYLHLVWAGGYDNALYYTTAPAWEASYSKGWAAPAPLPTGRTRDHSLAISLDGVLHLAYVQMDPSWQIHYMYSTDSGDTWRTPILVSDTEPGSSASDVQLRVDTLGNVFVVWQENPLPDEWPSRAVLYASSTSRGEDWVVTSISEKDETFREDYGPGQIGIGLVDRQIHLVWNGQPIGYRTHQWSEGINKAFTLPAQIQDPALDFRYFTGKPVLLTDALGTLHLITSSNGLRHVSWQLGRWSLPDRAVGEYTCVNPRAVIGLGDTVHAVWFDEGDADIWYSSRPIAAPAQAAHAYPDNATILDSPSYAIAAGSTDVATYAEDTPLIQEQATSVSAHNNQWWLIGAVLPTFIFVALVMVVRLRKGR